MVTRFFPFMGFFLLRLLYWIRHKSALVLLHNEIHLSYIRNTNTMKEKYFIFSSQLFSFWIFSGQYSFVYFRLLGFLVLMPAYFRPQVYSFDSVSICLVLKWINIDQSMYRIESWILSGHFEVYEWILTFHVFGNSEFVIHMSTELWLTKLNMNFLQHFTQCCSQFDRAIFP